MKILDRKIGTQLSGTFFVALVALVALFDVTDLIAHRRLAISEGQVPWSVVFHYYVLLLPRLLTNYYLTGLAALFSVLFVVGTMVHRNELTAALAAGISLTRILRVPVVGAIVMDRAGIVRFA